MKASFTFVAHDQPCYDTLENHQCLQYIHFCQYLCQDITPTIVNSTEVPYTPSTCSYILHFGYQSLDYMDYMSIEPLCNCSLQRMLEISTGQNKALSCKTLATLHQLFMQKQASSSVASQSPDFVITMLTTLFLNVPVVY